MSKFQINTGVKVQGAGTKDQGSGTKDQGSVVNCEMGFTPLKNFTNKNSCKIMNKHFNDRKLSPILNSLTGFTMTELVVVMALMSILVAMAYSQFRTPNEQIACKEIYSNLQLAKLKAVSTGANVVVDIDTDLNSVEDVNVPDEVTYIPDASGSINQPSGWGGFPTGGSDFEGGDTVTFTSKGMATSGSFYLYDVNNSDRLCAVRVLSTGLVRMSTSVNMGATWN